MSNEIDDLEAEIFLTPERLGHILTQQGIREGQLHITQSVEVTGMELEDDIIHLDLLIKNPKLH